MYGPVRTVVWQGSVGDRRPYANQIAIRLTQQEAALGEADVVMTSVIA